MLASSKESFNVGDWCVEPLMNRISLGPDSISLRPQLMELLVYLAERNGQVANLEGIHDDLWSGKVVSTGTIYNCVAELRHAFARYDAQTTYIETIPKKGYRLAASVSGADTQIRDPAPSTPSAAAANERWYSSGRNLSAAAGLILIAAVLVWYWWAPTARQRTLVIEDTPSIAVLPFVDLGPGKDQEYFADGLSEDLLNKLARIKDLRVIGRTSSFYFKDKNEALQDIGKTLDVGHILEGSVRRAGDELRITAQLVDVSNGYQVWSDNFDRPLEDIFQIQDEIAEAVSMALSITLSVGDIGGLIGGTTNPDAYNEYLLAQSLYREFTPGSISAAVEKFKLAIEIDPNYALAWERLADIYVSSLYLSGLELHGDWRKLSDEALNRAISLAPTSQAVIATTAYRHIHLNEWQEAARVLERGENPEISTNDTLVRTNAHLLGSVGRGREAIPLMERARRLDPLSAIVSIYLVPEYVEAGRFEEADADLERIWNLGEYQSLFGQIGLGLAFSSRNLELMEEWVGRFLEFNNNHGGEVHLLMFDMIDDREGALSWLRNNYSEDEEVVPRYAISMWAAFHGDAELALKTLPDYANPQMLWYDNYSEIRRLEGFKDIVLELGLVDYWREFGWSEHCRPVGEDDFECG